MRFPHQLIGISLALFLMIPSTISMVDAGGKTTANLCRGCHSDNYGDYVTLSQFSVPSEVGEGETFTVSVRMVLSGNLDQSRSYYWEVDTDVTLSSSQNKFSFAPATYSHNDKLPGDVVDITWQLTADQGIGTDTLTVSVYAIAQHFSRSGSDQLSSGIEVTSPNRPPQLSQPAFSPTQGDVNQLFGFEVLWSDANGDFPSYLRLILDGNSLPLFEANPGAQDPVTGVKYASSSMTLSPGYHTYFFQASDGEAGIRMPAGDEVTQGPQGPLTGVYSGPFVGVAPNIGNDSLTPMVGDESTDFTYSITLLLGDDMNSTQVSFWLDGVESGIQPTVIDLGNQGRQYDFKTQLSAGVTHFHHFTATNSFGSVRFPAGGESLVGPVLVGDVLSAASLSPTQGDEKTLYNFSINYSNPAAIAPSAVAVVIDGNSILLNSTSATANWSVSTQFTMSTLLSVGNHSYHFEAYEGGRSHRIPKSGELSLQVFRFDSDPWLSNASVLVEGVEIFNESSAIFNGDIANTSRPTYLSGTEVEVRITFNDLEGDEPLDSSLIAWINGTPNLLLKLDNNSPMVGQTWGFKTTSLEVGENHSLYFTAASSYVPMGAFEGIKLRFPGSENRSLPLPSIEAPPPPNLPPVLKPPSDGRLMLDPFAGAESENYTFLVEVSDADWTPQSQLEVWLELDGEIHPMKPVNQSDHQNGTVFGITIQLDVGEHLHRFGVRDAEDESAYPETGMVSGPTVQANMIPVDELVSRPVFVSWAWWLVLGNLLLIFGGIGWATMTLREARGVVFTREVEKMAKIIQEFDEKVALEEEIPPEEVSDIVWRTRPPEAYRDSGFITSTVDENRLFAELGGVPRAESSGDPALQELLDDLQIDDLI